MCDYDQGNEASIEWEMGLLFCFVSFCFVSNQGSAGFWARLGMELGHWG